MLVEQGVKQQRLSHLESQSDESWLNQRRAEQVKALVHEVHADADTRASLLQDGMTAGHNGKHFFLASADGSFLLELSGQIQLRYIYNDRDRSGADDGEFGMQIRRTKVQFAGHIASPKLHYAVQLEVSRGDNGVTADKILIGYDLTDDLYIWAGEDEVAFTREGMTSSKYQLAVERSSTNAHFTIDKAQGAGIKWSSDMFIVQAFINDGAYSGSGGASVAGLYKDFSPDPESKDFNDDNVDFAITSRVDVKLMGQWAQLRDFTSWPGEEMAVFLGGGLHYQTGETGSTAGDDRVIVWTVDGSIEVNGLSLFVAYSGASADNDSGVDTDPVGIVVQGAYNMPLNGGQSVEPYIRWERFDLDDIGSVSSVLGYDDEIDVLVVGGNYYFNNHNAKLTADVVWLLDAFPSASSGSGLLADVASSDDQLALRVQFQLLW